MSSCYFQLNSFGGLVDMYLGMSNRRCYSSTFYLINGAIFRYELCFNGEKVVKSAPASHVHGSETGRPQTNNAHASNGERSGVDGESSVIDIFRWSRCKRPLPQKSMQSIGIPLPLEHVEVIFLIS